MIPNNYDGLVSAVKALAEDDSVEFASYIPTAIYLAEENLGKKVDTEGVYQIATVTASAGNNILAKPSGHKFNKEFSFVNIHSSFVQPEMRTKDFVKDYWPTAMVSTSDYPFGEPKYYANEDNSNWVIAPTPDSNYVFTVKYGAQIEHLSALNQENYFTSNTADALFYGTMVGISEFMKDYEITPIWTKRYIDAVTAVNNEGRRQRTDDGNFPSNPKSGLNTLNQGEN